MYLENIFIGSEDIRKQLPQESVLFEGVHATFQQKMKELQTVSKVVQVNTLGGQLIGGPTNTMALIHVACMLACTPCSSSGLAYGQDLHSSRHARHSTLPCYLQACTAPGTLWH